MKKIISFILLLIMLNVTTGLNQSVSARHNACDPTEHDTRDRDSRNQARSPAEPCPDISDPPSHDTDLNVVLQDTTHTTHIQPGTDSVTIAGILLDATNSSEDIHTTKLEFIIHITSFAEYGSLQNCGLYQGSSLLPTAGVSREVITNSNSDVTVSRGVFTYELPFGALVVPQNDTINVELLCDLPAKLTQASIVSQLSDDNFEVEDAVHRSVDYSIVPQLSHTIEVYSGITPPWKSDNPSDDSIDPDNANDGDNGSDGGDGDDGEDKGHDGDTDADDDSNNGTTSRRDRSTQTDRR